MNKYLIKCITIVFLLFTSNAIAQSDDKITVMSKITCECIDNISDKIWENDPKSEIEDCFNAAVLGGLLSMISLDSAKETDSIVVELGSNKVKNGETIVNEINDSDLELTKQQLRKNCERYIAFENNNSGDIKQISIKACDCIGKIDIGLEKKEANESINSCITNAIITNQVQNDLIVKLSKALDSISSNKKELDSLVIGGDKEIMLSENKDYDKIEEYLLRNCLKLKVLISSDNKQFDYSYSTNKKALKFYNQGITYYKERNYKKALPKFKKALKEDKKFGFAWDNLGICQRQLGKYKEAIQSYNESLSLDPSGRMPLMNVPVAYEYLKDYDKAIKAYKRFSNIYPNDPEGHYGIARMYHKKENYKEALESMLKAYISYKEIKSPYIQDAEKNISLFYNEMKQKGMLDVFDRITKKYNVTIN